MFLTWAQRRSIFCSASRGAATAEAATPGGGGFEGEGGSGPSNKTGGQQRQKFANQTKIGTLPTRARVMQMPLRRAVRAFYRQLLWRGTPCGYSRIDHLCRSGLSDIQPFKFA